MDSFLSKFAKDFAPGIPSKKVKRAIPVVTEPTMWDYARQHHYALRAGFHTDLRISDGQRAFSWAIRHFPEKPGETRLALRQSDHRKGYMKWEGNIPAHVYGGGKVVLHDLAKAEVLESSPTKLRFNLYHKRDPQEFILIKTDDEKKKDRWLIKNVTLTRKVDKSTTIPETRPTYKETSIAETPAKYLGSDYLASAKLEGAHSIFYFDGKKIRAASYRPTERESGVIDHTYKLPLATLQKTPAALKGTLLRGEIYGVDKNGKALACQEVSGLLNSSVQRARETQKEKGQKLVPAIFDIIKYKGKDVTHLPYSERFEIVKKIVSSLKHFEVPRVAHTEEDKLKLMNDIRRNKEPRTKEGVVFWNLKDPHAAPVKAKIRPDFDVYVREIFEGDGKYKKSAGGFKYSLKSGGEIVGNVGIGLSDALRQDMWDHPRKYIGRVAKVTAQEQFPSGALRAPAFTDWHVEKGKQASVKQASPQPIVPGMSCYAAARRLISANPTWSLHRGPPEPKELFWPEDTAHFWAVDDKGKVHDPTAMRYPGYDYTNGVPCHSGTRETISFPKHEHDDLIDRLSQGKSIYTTRVSAELGKYKPGKVYTAPWGDKLSVQSVKQLTSIDDHPFKSELSEAQKKELSSHGKMALVKLQKHASLYAPLFKLAKHILVTGFSGSGKTTYAKDLAKKKNLPIIHLDEDPRWKPFMKAHPELDHLKPGTERDKLLSLVDSIVSKALVTKKPHVIEGSQLAYGNISKIKKHDRILIATPVDEVVNRRVQRATEKRRARGEDVDRPGFREEQVAIARKLIAADKKNMLQFGNLHGTKHIKTASLKLSDFDPAYYAALDKRPDTDWNSRENPVQHTVTDESGNKLGVVGTFMYGGKPHTNIAVGPEHRGKGLLSEFYRLLVDKYKHPELYAYVDKTNLASQKAHEKDWFQKVSETGEKILYKRDFSKYDPPRGLEFIQAKYPHLLKDPAHMWRAKSGVELIHREPDVQELKRIMSNWHLMSDEQKSLSDAHSKQLFGKTNVEHFNELLPTYEKQAAEKRPPGLEAGRAAGMDDDEFDADQIMKGIEVEHEHTDKDSIAKAISKDHLTEDDKYYDHLDAMEEKYQKKAALGMLRAYAMYLDKKAQSDKPYRDRVEVYAVKDGKILGGVYPDGNFGVFGGGLDHGEKPKKAAKREFKEESGYKIENIHPAYLPAVKSRWSDADLKRLSKKDPKRTLQYQGSRTMFFVAKLGEQATKNPEDKTRMKGVKLYPFEEVLELLGKSGDNQRLLDARIRLVRNLVKYEKSAQLLEPLLAIR